MKINLQNYLRTFENGGTIEAFSLVDGPSITYYHLCEILNSHGKHYENVLEDYYFNLLDSLDVNDNCEECVDTIKYYINNNLHMDELKPFITSACDVLGCDIAKIKTLAPGTKDELFKRITEEYLSSQVIPHMNEFFISYLIKYVLLPSGIKELDKELFDKFFSSNNYGLEHIDTDHKQLINGFKQFLSDNGII